MVEVKIPYVFREIGIGETDKDKREAVKSNKGRLAVIKDDHYSPLYPSGILKEGDAVCYFLEPVGKGSTRRFHYHDLTMLLVSGP